MMPKVDALVDQFMAYMRSFDPNTALDIISPVKPLAMRKDDGQSVNLATKKEATKRISSKPRLRKRRQNKLRKRQRTTARTTKVKKSKKARANTQTVRILPARGVKIVAPAILASLVVAVLVVTKVPTDQVISLSMVMKTLISCGEQDLRALVLEVKGRRLAYLRRLCLKTFDGRYWKKAKEESKGGSPVRIIDGEVKNHQKPWR